MPIPKNISERAEKLREIINRHNYLYHTLDKPEIPDTAYDALVRELEDIETQYPEIVTPDSPTQRVGGEPIVAFEKVEHVVPQWSFDDAFDEDDIRLFDNRIRKNLVA